jgi:tetratricopeptide (TPR) repeat protein
MLAELTRLTPKITSSWWRERVQIEHDVVAGWIAFATNDARRAEELLRSAARRELAAGKDSAEPGHVIVAVEELGDLLLALGRPAEALEAYEDSLEESPRRFNALHGAGRAAELAGMTDRARKHYAELVELSVATTSRPAVARARAFLARP